MYKISINSDLSIADVFNTEIYLDDSVATFPITVGEFQLISQSGRHDFWQYKNGSVVESEFKADILKSEFNAQQEKKRASAYQKESDPLFMKYQRGTATQEEWLAKVEEIKLRYPYQI